MHYDGMIHEEKAGFISYLINSISYHMGGLMWLLCLQAYTSDRFSKH
jgi:hypothetical protein